MTDLRIPSPCHEDWNAMTPQSRGRHCASCDRVVVDVASMTGLEASTFMAGADAALRSGARVCVHASLDTHGKVLVPSPSIARGRARLLTNALAAMLAMSIAGCNNGPTGGQNADGGQGTGEQLRSGDDNHQADDVSLGAAGPIGNGVTNRDVVVGTVMVMPGMMVASPPPEPPTPTTGRMVAPETPPADPPVPHMDG